jgi:4-amino-4-deoxy-L-arabinose transferase-like glycosyltransferase
MAESTDNAGVVGRRAAKAVAWTLLWAVMLAGHVRLAGSLALSDPDEGRNAEVAREMAASGDFVVPRLNDLPYLDKPIFLFAASALSMRAFGVDELAARLPALVSSLATVGLVVGFGWFRFGRKAGVLAGMILASSPLILAFGGIVIFDAPMMLWVTCATMAFHLTLERGQKGWCLAGWAAVSLAVLTKGPVGFVLPLLIGVGDALANRRPVRRLFCPAGPAVFVVLVGVWFAAVTVRHPDFPYYAFVRETFERVATDSMRRTGPWYYFLPILVAGTFPWVTVLPAGGRSLLLGLRRRAEGMSDEMFLLLWAVLPLVFFSLSQSKRPGYILPIVPALALLGGRMLQVSPVSLRYAVWIAAPIAAALGAALLFAGGSATSLIREAPEVAETLSAVAPYIGVGLIGTAGLAMLGLRWPGAALAAFVLMPMVPLLGGRDIYTALSEQRSGRELAGAIRNAARGEPRVVGVGAYSPSLAFYLQTPLLVAADSPNELRSNYIKDHIDTLRDVPGSTLMTFHRWREELEACQPQTVFVVPTGNGSDEQRRMLAAELPLLHRTYNYEAYGPCGAGNL